MHHCLYCDTTLEVTRVACSACEIAYEGRFQLPRLARLDPDQQHLAEQIVLTAGNLKEVAQGLEVSYPTLRKRLDSLIESLKAVRADDEARTRSLLDSVEAGARTPEEASRLIKELKGAL